MFHIHLHIYIHFHSFPFMICIVCADYAGYNAVRRQLQKLQDIQQQQQQQQSDGSDGSDRFLTFVIGNVRVRLTWMDRDFSNMRDFMYRLFREHTLDETIYIMVNTVYEPDTGLVIVKNFGPGMTEMTEMTEMTDSSKLLTADVFARYVYCRTCTDAAHAPLNAAYLAENKLPSAGPLLPSEIRARFGSFDMYDFVHRDGRILTLRADKYLEIHRAISATGDYPERRSTKVHVRYRSTSSDHETMQFREAIGNHCPNAQTTETIETIVVSAVTTNKYARAVRGFTTVLEVPDSDTLTYQFAAQYIAKLIYS